MKHFRLKGASGQDPRLLFEARLNLHDVRSGYNDTCLVLASGPILEDIELGWTADMVEHHRWDQLEEFEPPRDVDVSPLADNQLVDFLLRCHEVSIWHNAALRLYSEPGESRADFSDRCREAAAQRQAEGLQKIQDVYLHRFLELEQRALEAVDAQQWGPEVLDQKLAATRDVFSGVREELSRSFLKRGLTTLSEAELQWGGEGLPVEVAERLEDLKLDFLRRYEELHVEIVTLAEQIDSYPVPVSYSEVRVEMKAVVWK